MRDLFRSFDREGVRYLLIGGQAAILYGASQFTQDLDIWVEPTAANLRALLRSLANLDGKVHKLTPPVTTEFVQKGHGFHFVLGGLDMGPTFLDVMGRPPRVQSFAAAARRASTMSTSWGKVRVVAIQDLVELKKTNRLGDYEVISRLARLRLDGTPRPSAALLAWALANAFRVEDSWAIVRRHRDRLADLAKIDPLARIVLRSGSEACDEDPSALARVADGIERRVSALVRKGREYWLPRLAELRALHRAGRLVPEGTPVRDLLGAHD